MDTVDIKLQTMKSEPETRMRGIPAKILTSHGYSVCLFPEQPKRQIVEEPEHIESEENIYQAFFDELKNRKKLPPNDEVIRLHWRNRLVYLIAFIAFSTSLHNIYHFPMNIYRYGVVFFVPYTIATIVIGYPMLILETSVGQYSQRGSLWMWSCAPLFFGAGAAMLAACVVTSLYHNIFSAYALVYFAHCFNRVLPWTYCSDVVWEEDKDCAPPSWYVSENVSIPSKDYFYNMILNTPSRYKSEVRDLGPLKWWLITSFLFSWILVYVATLRSSRSIGKIAIVIVIFSYFGILTLTIVAFHLKNSGQLILHKETNSVFNLKMWCAAIIQVLLELGICHGIPVVYGSYCRFRNSLHIDSLVLCVFNYMNSLIFFYLFFCFARSFSCNYEKMLWNVPDTTVGVVYMIYSEAFVNLAGSHLWCAIFFFMLFLIIIGTQVAIAEAIMAAIYDHFVKWSQHRWMINLLICGAFFVLGIVFCFGNGYFGAISLDYIPIFFTSIPLSCIFLVGIVFVYGFQEYSKNMKTMLDYNLDKIVNIFLYFIIIAFVASTIILLFSTHSAMFKGDRLLYPETYITLAWSGCAVIVFPFIVYVVFWTTYCWRTQTKILTPLQTWKTFEEKKKEGTGQFTSDYFHSYTWEWNK